MCLKHSLRCIDTDYPNWYRLSSFEKGWVSVGVDKIIGGSNTKNMYYWSNWELKISDSGIKSLECGIKKNCMLDSDTIDKKKASKFLSSPWELTDNCNIYNPIGLLCVVSEDLIMNYYVYYEGFHRVSLAHKYNLKNIYAFVTAIYYTII
jgi:hypothetical protein